MNRNLMKFLVIFFLVFITNYLLNGIFKGEWNSFSAFLIAIGFSAGYILMSIIVGRKKKDE